MAWCSLCKRSFKNEQALEQHTRDAPVHGLSYNCNICDRSFVSEQALEQHTRDAPAHSLSYNCNICDRSFVDEQALEQHTHDTPAHNLSYNCSLCKRSFKNEQALEQHTRDTPVHSPSYNCDICDRSFVHEQALEQHFRDAPAHSLSYNCNVCDRSFVDEQALEQHIRDSPAHTPERSTPLDIFFQSFPAFPYDPTLSPAESYTQLRKFHRWQRDGPDSNKAWDRYQSALREELELWLGSEDDIGAWHALCRAIRIKPLPTTCDGCEKAVRNRHVNLVDLIEWGRGRGDAAETDVCVFNSIQELGEYSRRTGKIFRNNLGDSEEGNVVLRHLLRRIFNPLHPLQK